MANINAKSVNFEGVDYYYNTFTTTEILEYRGLRDMYYGSGGFSDGSYLKKFPRESDGGFDENGNPLPDYFSTRKSIAHYENIFRPELDSQVDAIFAKDQVRETSSQIVEQFINNPSKRNNETMSEYQRRKKIEAKLYGAVFEICDAPNVNVISGAMDGSPDLMPYCFYLNPLQIEGYAFDSTGALSMLIYYIDLDQRNNVNGTTVKSDDYKYKVWLNTGSEYVSFEYEADMVLEDTVKRDYENAPITLLEDNTRYQANVICKSKYIDMLTVSKKIYNITSWFNDSFFKNCFAFLVVNGKLPPDIDLGNDGVMEVTAENAFAPLYVAPPTEHLSVMIGELERLIINFKQNMNSTVAIASTASGEARMEADRRRIEKLKQDAKDIQDNETWLVNVALREYLDDNYTYTVVYPKDFESLTKEDELASLQALIDTGYLKQPVIDEIIAKMIQITLAFDKKEAERLAQLQIETVETTENDTFETAPIIEDEE